MARNRVCGSEWPTLPLVGVPVFAWCVLNYKEIAKAVLSCGIVELDECASNSTSRLLIAAMLVLAFSGLTFHMLVVPIFFGYLRDIELTRLWDRAVNYFLFKIVFIGAILKPRKTELIGWLVYLSLVGFGKIVTRSTHDRYSHFCQTVNPKAVAHNPDAVKMLVLLILVFLGNSICLQQALTSFYSLGTSKLLLLLFEVCVIYCDVVQAMLKYSLQPCSNTGGARLQSNACVYYADFVGESVVALMTVAHYVHIWNVNGLTFSPVDVVLFLSMRKVFLSIRARVQALNDYRRAKKTRSSRRAHFPDY